MTLILKILIGLGNLIYLPFKLLPVKEKLTFISRQADEPSEDMRLLAAALREAAPGLEIKFLCKTLKPGLGRKIGYCFHLLAQMYHIATSKVVALDSYCAGISLLRQRRSLIVIQMWHALGSLKKFGYSIVGEGEGRSERTAEALKMHRNYTWILASGRPCVPHFCEAFGYDGSHIKVASLPRVDRLTDAGYREEVARRIHERYPQFAGKEVVVYAPTFRKDRDISAQIDSLAAAFDPQKYAFVLKKHPLMQESCSCLTDEEFSTLEMILAADYVICDYSAVVFEAAVAGKPLFFYDFDYDEYGVDRDFYIDYMREMPGPVASEAKTIAGAIAQGSCDLERVRAFGTKYVENQEDCAGALARFISDQIFT